MNFRSLCFASILVISYFLENNSSATAIQKFKMGLFNQINSRLITYNRKIKDEAYMKSILMCYKNICICCPKGKCYEIDFTNKPIVRQFHESAFSGLYNLIESLTLRDNQNQ